MSWEEEFNAAMAAFGAIVPEAIEYRLHYDDSGLIIMCSHQNHPDSQQYLVVDESTYLLYTEYRVDVEKKKLIKVEVDLGIRVQLKKSNAGFKVVKNHAGLILESDETTENIEYYDSPN